MFTLIFGYLNFAKYFDEHFSWLTIKTSETFITCHVTVTGKVNRSVFVILDNQVLRIVYTEVNHLYLAAHVSIDQNTRLNVFIHQTHNIIFKILMCNIQLMKLLLRNEFT